MAVLELRSVSKNYVSLGNVTEVLSDVSMILNKNESAAILGPSGSGKTTLLQIAGLLDCCTSGEVIINGVNYANSKEKDLVVVRRESIGFVYQSHCLIPEMTAIENVMLPLAILRQNKSSARKRAEDILFRLGIESAQQNRRPIELSGGEGQRVAIARAFVTRPALLLADEPTGNLDGAKADVVFNLILELSREYGTAALIITHNEYLAKKLDRTMTIRGKHLVSSEII